MEATGRMDREASHTAITVPQAHLQVYSCSKMKDTKIKKNRIRSNRVMEQHKEEKQNQKQRRDKTQILEEPI